MDTIPFSNAHYCAESHMMEMEEKSAPRTQWPGGWMGSRASSEMKAVRKALPLLGMKLVSLASHFANQSFLAHHSLEASDETLWT
jgi:hypothetical protein